MGEGVFLPNKLTAWTGNIVVSQPARAHWSHGFVLLIGAHCGAQEGVLKRLAALNKPLKYIGALLGAQRRWHGD